MIRLSDRVGHEYRRQNPDVQLQFRRWQLGADKFFLRRRRRSDGGSYSDTNFTDISGVGLYLTSGKDRARETSTGTRYWWYGDDFTVDAVIVPKPAPAGMLLAAGALLVIRHRLRNR